MLGIPNFSTTSLVSHAPVKEIWTFEISLVGTLKHLFTIRLKFSRQSIIEHGVFWPSVDAFLKIELNIFTAKIFGIILNGKMLLYSGLSWIFWLRSDGLIIASKIMYPTFRLITQSINAQSEEGKERTEHKCKAGNKFSFRNKTGKIATAIIKNS